MEFNSAINMKYEICRKYNEWGEDSRTLDMRNGGRGNSYEHDQV